MSGSPLASFALALAFASLVVIGPAAADPREPSPPCQPPQAPLPPQPLQVQPADIGVRLVWHDDANPDAGMTVDDYEIFRVDLHGVVVPAAPLAVVDGWQHSYVDPQGNAGVFLYWVKAHNCQGSSIPSNPATNQAKTCADWSTINPGWPPLSWAWVDTGCTGGASCVVLVTLAPFSIQDQGCPVAFP